MAMQKLISQQTAIQFRSIFRVRKSIDLYRRMLEVGSNQSGKLKKCGRNNSRHEISKYPSITKWDFNYFVLDKKYFPIFPADCLTAFHQHEISDCRGRLVLSSHCTVLHQALIFISIKKFSDEIFFSFIYIWFHSWQ